MVISELYMLSLDFNPKQQKFNLNKTCTLDINPNKHNVPLYIYIYIFVRYLHIYGHEPVAGIYVRVPNQALTLKKKIQW